MTLDTFYKIRYEVMDKEIQRFIITNVKENDLMKEILKLKTQYKNLEQTFNLKLEIIEF